MMPIGVPTKVASTTISSGSATSNEATLTKARKLTFKERGELDALPDRIDAMEREREQLYAQLSDPALLRNPTALADARTRLATLDTGLAALVARWEELELVASEMS